MKKQKICIIFFLIKRFLNCFIKLIIFSRLDEFIDDDFFYQHCFRLGRCGNFAYVNCSSNLFLINFFLE